MSDYYSENAEKFINQYESVSATRIHEGWSHLIPPTKSLILDVGAGSGRDASWLCSLGHEVIAVEPSKTLLNKAQLLHPAPAIQWINDYLPALKHTYKMGLKFDIILLSAVWIHVPPSHHSQKACNFN